MGFYPFFIYLFILLYENNSIIESYFIMHGGILMFLQALYFVLSYIQYTQRL